MHYIELNFAEKCNKFHPEPYIPIYELNFITFLFK
jgi:hypothetical protein